MTDLNFDGAARNQPKLVTDLAPVVGSDGTPKITTIPELATLINPLLAPPGFVNVGTVSRIFSGIQFTGMSAGLPDGTSARALKLPFGPDELRTSYEEAILTLTIMIHGDGDGLQDGLHFGVVFGSAYAPLSNIGADAGLNNFDPEVAQTFTVRLGTDYATYDPDSETWQWCLTLGHHGSAPSIVGTFTIVGSIDRELSQTSQPSQWRKVFGNDDDPYLLPYRVGGSDSFFTAREIIPLDTAINYTQTSLVLIRVSPRDLAHHYGETIPELQMLFPSQAIWENRTYRDSAAPSTVQYDPRKCIHFSARGGDIGAYALGGANSSYGTGFGIQFVQADTVMPDIVTHFAVMFGVVSSPYSRGMVKSIEVL